MQKGSKFLKNSVTQIGPFDKIQIHVASRSQSSTPQVLNRECFLYSPIILWALKEDICYVIVAISKAKIIGLAINQFEVFKSHS